MAKTLEELKKELQAFSLEDLSMPSTLAGWLALNIEKVEDEERKELISEVLTRAMSAGRQAGMAIAMAPGRKKAKDEKELFEQLYGKE